MGCDRTGPGPFPVATGLLGGTLASLVRKRADALGLDRAARRAAEDLVAHASQRMSEETGINRAFSEVRLYKEWRNDLLAKPGDDQNPWARITADPATPYMGWLDWRLAHPFHVSYRVVDAAARRMGVSTANLLVDIRWPQEVAWARRIRKSADERDVLVGHRFLLAAIADASSEFAKLAGAYAQASDDPAYVLAPEHDYAADEVAAGYGSPDFGPLFLRHGRAVLADRLGRMSAKELRASAAVARRSEDTERGNRARRRAAANVRAANMARSPGIISIAVEAGLGADGLVDAQAEFARLVEAGAVPVPPDVGLPYEEFCAWLRTAQAPSQTLLMPGDDLSGETELLGIVSNPIDWVRSLPRDYHDMGASDPRRFHRWLAPIASRERAFPRDAVVDYGFQLVAESFGIAP